ncbi:MAG: hypothetical protein PUB95_05020 [Methanobrevibacter ruminantium]|uniref:hypothetical protein n=1 Tax=Methanobrevibacter ruminantium TaxID=83816 RepID=UPI0026EEF026|nr:hypothetical protein [Methanobrevibacter ruminantium]MDD6048796.1 hypothetical protein [Methanobrevibacter ruminantium]
MKNLIKDQYGLLYSSELLLSIILLIFIIGVVANLSDGLNEKILSEEEISSLEAIAIESSDYLLNNPGNPENWEDDEGLKNGIVSKNIIPGLAIKNKNVENGEFFDESASDEMIMSNAISYNKLIKIKNNYDSLVDRNLFNDSVMSSMVIYPLNSQIRPIEMGYDFDNENDNVNDNNIVTVNRTVKCDFYSNFVVYNFNDFELFGDDYNKDMFCNHDTNPNLTNHSNDGRSLWVCKSFRVYKESLDEYEYYLISDESVKDTGTYWIFESLNRTKENKEILNQEVIDLNPFFLEDLENSSDEIYSIHFNVPKNRANDFKTVLVAIPKNMTDVLISNDGLNYDYFRVQDVNFVLKAGYR